MLNHYVVRFGFWLICPVMLSWAVMVNHFVDHYADQMFYEKRRRRSTTHPRMKFWKWSERVQGNQPWKGWITTIQLHTTILASIKQRRLTR